MQEACAVAFVAPERLDLAQQQPRTQRRALHHVKRAQHVVAPARRRGSRGVIQRLDTYGSQVVFYRLLPVGKRPMHRGCVVPQPGQQAGHEGMHAPQVTPVLGVVADTVRHQPIEPGVRLTGGGAQPAVQAGWVR